MGRKMKRSKKFEREVINTYHQLHAAGGGVALTAHYTGIRTMSFNGYGVYRVNTQGKQLVTDKDAHWQHYGMKIFSLSSAAGDTKKERKANALEAAKRWVAEQGWYTGKWERNRVQDYVSKEINERFPLRKQT
jgi:hypothetical protein